MPKSSIDKYINKIICGDCLDILKDFPDSCVDLVLTDPPYGILGGAKSIGGANIVEPTIYPIMDWDYKPFNKQQLKEIIRISENQIIFGYNHFSNILPNTSCAIAWDKACQNGWNDTFADGELAWTSFRKPTKFYRLLWKGALRVERNIERQHPTQKPLQLMKWILQDFSKEDDLILDPFCGSGTTCVAAKMLGRRYIGIDISPEYCEIARQRLEAVDTGVPVKEARAGQIPLFK